MIYQCQKCGLSKSDSAMGSVLPQCKCDWNAPAVQRQWVGLTDEEQDEIAAYHGLDCMAYETAFRTIEAKLKEKNT